MNESITVVLDHHSAVPGLTAFAHDAVLLLLNGFTRHSLQSDCFDR